MSPEAFSSKSVYTAWRQKCPKRIDLDLVLEKKKVYWPHSAGPSVFPAQVTSPDDEIKRWKLKYGANGSPVFRIQVESELKLGLSVSITLLLLVVREKSEANSKLELSKIGIERFQIRLRGELGSTSSSCKFSPQNYPSKSTSLMINFSGARLAGLYGCPICGLGLTPPELEEHFTQEVPPPLPPKAIYQQLHQCQRHHLGNTMAISRLTSWPN